MNGGILMVSAMGIISSMLVGNVIVGHIGEGPSWTDTTGAGHSLLADQLSQERSVRIIESSLALIPDDAGSGDSLFLFPGHRPTSQIEVDRINDFVHKGGSLVIAADGQRASPWMFGLSIDYKGLPAVLPPSHQIPCVPLSVSLSSAEHEVCLPSPTVFANLTSQPTESSWSSDVPVYLDTDQDGNVSLGDQGPAEAVMALAWTHGAGRILAIADGDLWRNQVLEDHPDNVRLATAIAASTPLQGTVYLDSTGTQPSTMDRMIRPLYRAVSAPDAAQWTAAVIGFVLVLAGVALAPRMIALLPHDPPEGVGDIEVELAAADVIKRHLGREPSISSVDQVSVAASQSSTDERKNTR